MCPSYVQRQNPEARRYHHQRRVIPGLSTAERRPVLNNFPQGSSPSKTRYTQAQAQAQADLGLARTSQCTQVGAVVDHWARSQARAQALGARE